MSATKSGRTSKRFARMTTIYHFMSLLSPTIDWRISDGVQDIPIEERPEHEITHIQGQAPEGQIAEVQVTPRGVAGATLHLMSRPIALSQA